MHYCLDNAQLPKEDLISSFQTRASETPYLLHRFHHVLGAGVLLVRKREGSVGGGRHDWLSWVVMMRSEGEGSEETTTQPTPPFIRQNDKQKQTRKQIKTNEVT